MSKIQAKKVAVNCGNLFLFMCPKDVIPYNLRYSCNVILEVPSHKASIMFQMTELQIHLSTKNIVEMTRKKLFIAMAFACLCSVVHAQEKRIGYFAEGLFGPAFFTDKGLSAFGDSPQSILYGSSGDMAINFTYTPKQDEGPAKYSALFGAGYNQNSILRSDYEKIKLHHINANLGICLSKDIHRLEFTSNIGLALYNNETTLMENGKMKTVEFNTSGLSLGASMAYFVNVRGLQLGGGIRMHKDFFFDFDKTFGSYAPYAKAENDIFSITPFIGLRIGM